MIAAAEVVIEVRNSAHAYIASANGLRASCIAGPIQAVRALAKKIFPGVEVRAEFIGREGIVEHWRISPRDTRSRLRDALQRLYEVAASLDAELDGERPTEAEYRAAMAEAKAAMAAYEAVFGTPPITGFQPATAPSFLPPSLT